MKWRSQSRRSTRWMTTSQDRSLASTSTVMSEPIREQLEVLIAQTKMSNGHLPVGVEIGWVHNLADAIIAEFPALSSVGETEAANEMPRLTATLADEFPWKDEAAKQPLDPEGDSGLTSDVLNLLVSTYDGWGIGIWIDHYAVADEKRRQTMIGSLYR
jgi:hypothetical protein